MLLLLATSTALAQRELSGGRTAPPPPPPAPDLTSATVSYAVDAEAAHRDPARFSLTIDLLGHATYTAEDAAGGEQAGTKAEAANAEEGASVPPPYRSQFDVSPATRDRIFALAQGLDYFHGDFEFRKHTVADTGRKTFRYDDGMRHGEAVLNWSENKQMQELTNLCESIALTQNFARRLVYQRRFDRLGLEATLKRMEELAHANYLSELQAIAPVLRQVAGDPGVMHVARERANRMLDQVQAASQPAAAPSGARR